MNDHIHDNCARYETMIAAWFEADDLSPADRSELTTHIASCAACAESFQLASRMEAALISRREDVPAVDSFLPAMSSARVGAVSHPKLLAAFRTLMSPAGISITLTMWATLLALHFRNEISRVFVWTSSDRFSALGNDISGLLVSAARGDTAILTGMYVALTVIVLGSMGAITLRYVRHN